jgi:Protein of unknown function (DUF559)
MASTTDERCVDHAIRGKCSARDVDAVLAELGERQHGVAARWQLLEAGIGRRAIDERLDRRLLPVHRGVYAVGYASRCVESRWMAAVLAAGPEAVLSHRTAGQLWRLMPRSSHPTEVTRATYLRPVHGIRGYRSTLPDDERTMVDGIPVTTAPRTILDLAAVASSRQVERALNEMEVRRLTDSLSIPDLLGRYPRRRGSAVLRVLLGEEAHARGVTKRELEERFAALVDSYGIPKPRRNVDLAVRGRIFNVDCLWTAARLVVELDGRAVHGTRKAFEDDRERDRLMLTEGWQVIRITWRQLATREDAIASDLRKALTRGRALR